MSKNKESILEKSLKVGLSGSSAMVIQVTSLMWLRTTMNYQYRYGTSTFNAMNTLYNNGGIRRFYRGYLPALTIGPLARFGDTMMNSYAINSFEQTNLPTSAKTLIGSGLASSWRASLMPLDALKTTLQVEGKSGLNLLKQKIKYSGPKVLFHGTFAQISATFVGHYPWFLTYNILNEKLPKYDNGIQKFLRNWRLYVFQAWGLQNRVWDTKNINFYLFSSLGLNFSKF